MRKDEWAIIAFCPGDKPRVARYSGGRSRAKLKAIATRMNKETRGWREAGTWFDVRFAVHVPAERGRFGLGYKMPVFKHT